jgi:hypothetical protein
MNFADALEAANGVWALLALWLSVFMVYHLVVVRMQRRIKWKRFITGLPLSMQVAVGTLVIALAVFMTRVVIWWARYRHNGELDLMMPETRIYLSGTALGAVGFLCILRAVSRPVFGHWPWAAALASSAAYLVWWGWKFI